MLCPTYYCLYSLFNKIRDKGRTVSAWKGGGGGDRKGIGSSGGEMAQTLCAHMNKQKKNGAGTTRHTHAKNKTDPDTDFTPFTKMDHRPRCLDVNMKL
jgi:hypothetical protein